MTLLLYARINSWLSVAINVLFFPELWETPDITGFLFAIQKRNESRMSKIISCLKFSSLVKVSQGKIGAWKLFPMPSAVAVTEPILGPHALVQQNQPTDIRL